MPVGMKRIFITKLTDVSTSDKEGVGTRRREGDKEYIFLKGVASTVAGSVAAFDKSYATALLPAATSVVTGRRIGVAQAAIVASRWGWYQIAGPAASVACGGTCAAAGTPFNSKSTAGRLSTVDSGNDRIQGIEITVSAASNKCSVMLNYPYGDI